MVRLCLCLNQTSANKKGTWYCLSCLTLSLPLPHSYPQTVMWLSCRPQSQARSVLAVKEREGGQKQCVLWETCHCEWCAPVWGCCPLYSVSDHHHHPRPILQAKTLSISSHYSVTWNHGGKKPDQLLRLLNESNFLPESTRRAHTSIATPNYLTLIQINKSRRHQDCATPQWQTMTVHLYHCVRTATYSRP